MRKIYTLGIIVLFCSLLVSRTGVAQIAVMPDTVYTCPTQTSTLTANVVSGFGGNITSDDVFGPVINIGFNFDYFGNTYNQCVISANNFITFDLTKASGPSSYVYATALGNADLAKAIMFPFQDILPTAATATQMSYITFGYPGSRVFVVQFCRMPLYGCTNLLSTSQAVLYEGSNIIDIHIIDKPSGCTWQAGTGIVGLRDVPNEVLVPGKDVPNVQWADANKTYRFTPNAAGLYDIDSLPYAPVPMITFPDTNRLFWYAEGDTVNPIGIGRSIDVVPDGDIDYYVCKYYGDGVCYTDDSFAFYDTVYVKYLNYTGTTNVEVCAGEAYTFLGDILTAAGSYVYDLKTSLGCDSTLTLNLTINELPDPTLSTDLNLEICEGLTKKIELANPKSSFTYKWYKDGQEIIGETSDFLVVGDGGVYYVEITSSKGCVSKSLAVNVLVRENPIARIEAIGQGEPQCTYDTIVVSAYHDPSYEYTWFPSRPFGFYNTNLSQSSVKGVFRELKTEVELTVQNEYGCFNSTTFEVLAKPCCDVFIPNAFTPNGDGVNDEFAPLIRPGQVVIHFEVYDRYGAKVYSTNTAAPAWDGTYLSGKDAPTGVYMYQIIYTCDDGNNYTKKEAITLMR